MIASCYILLDKRPIVRERLIDARSSFPCCSSCVYALNTLLSRAIATDDGCLHRVHIHSRLEVSVGRRSLITPGRNCPPAFHSSICKSFGKPFQIFVMHSYFEFVMSFSALVHFSSELLNIEKDVLNSFLS